jgi:septum formation protein
LLNYDLTLASASPRRAEILTQIGVNFRAFPAEIDETPQGKETAIDYVQRMAREKVCRVLDVDIESKVVLGSDTTVVFGSEILGKPVHADDAIRMLSMLSGNAHQVLTSVVVSDGEQCRWVLSETEVKFRTISTQECHTYWQTGEPRDKAGAYAIQGYGAVFVESIKGSYSGVVGLPIAETARLLQQFNIPIWQY